MILGCYNGNPSQVELFAVQSPTLPELIKQCKMSGLDCLSIQCPFLISGMHTSPPTKKTLIIFLTTLTGVYELIPKSGAHKIIGFQWSLIVNNFDLKAVYAKHRERSASF